MEQIKKEEITFASYVLRLWQKRWLIILATFIVTLLMAVYVKFIAHEKYMTTAQVLVKRQPDFLHIEEEMNEFSPYTWASIFKSDDLLMNVLERTFPELAAQRNQKEKPILFEDFRKRFKTEIGKYEDTSIRTRYSPVIDLSVKGKTPQEAKKLMDNWIQLIIGRYGSLRSESLRYRKESLEEKMEAIQKHLETLEKEYMEVRWKLPEKIKMLTDKETLLSPSTIWTFTPRNQHDYIARTGLENIDIMVQQENPDTGKGEMGLRARLVDIQVTIASLEASTEPDAKKEIALRKAEGKKIEEIIKETESEITAAQQKVSALEQRYETLGREIETKRSEYRFLGETRAKLEIDADLLKKNVANGKEGPNLQVISEPILPDKRVEPKRALMCIITAALTFLLLCILVIVHKYLEEAARMTASAS